jgi:ferrous iron transport protein B
MPMAESDGPAPRAVRIAVAGNPNAGKTSIFNGLTGSSASVANYPGVTVETRTGRARSGGLEFEVVDLPGTYSLAAYSVEERVARDYLVRERPEVVIDVVDASNLERNLYLTVQLMEVGAPLVIALNMVDVARARGLAIDAAQLSRLLGVPVVPTVGSRGEGLEELLAACARATAKPPRPATVTYGHMVEAEVAGLAAAVAADARLAGLGPPRGLAVALLERDEDLLARLRALAGAEAAGALERSAAGAARRIAAHFREDAATVLTERRYGFAAGAVRECVRLTGQARQDLTDRLDAVACNRFLGWVILLAVVLGLFTAVFKLADEWGWIFGRSPRGWLEALFAWLAAGLAPLRESWPLLGSLLADGVVGGVGGVLSFVPLIFTLFLFVAALEDSGYIARVAFLLDRAFRAVGLQGKSVLALVVSGGLGGGGCAVPGVMAARTLRGERERLVTILVAPLMNCGAKMPVHLMLAAAFFAGRDAWVLLGLWILSWAVALAAAWGLRRFAVRGEPEPFVMELPPYHLPTLRGVLRHAWERTWGYLRKAGTILLAVSVVFWALMTFPRLDAGSAADFDARVAAAAGTDARAEVLRRRREAELGASLAGRLGRAVEPVTGLAGFSWRENVALLGGMAAKEVVVSALGTAYAMGEADPAKSEGLSERLSSDPAWNPLRALALMIFVTFYAPCAATLVTIRRETGTWKWAAFALLYTTVLAFVLATALYQGGRLLGFVPGGA